MKINSVILCLVLGVTGCSAIPSITPIDITANTGENQHIEDNIVGEINKTKVNSAESVVTNITEIDAFTVILLILGWMAPSPSIILSNFCKSVVFIFSSIGSFILKLFGR
jgi:hypothetical protein